jgi:phage-related protein (TIGR01555 family)
MPKGITDKPRRVPKALRADSAATKPAPRDSTQHGTRVARADDWANVASGLGVARYDKRLGSEIVNARRWSRDELLELYKGDAIAALIVDDRAEEMLRKWFTLQLDEDDGDNARTVMDAIDGVDGLPLRQKLNEALVAARRDGGAALYLGVNDGQAPDKPINYEAIQSFDFVNVLDRWSLTPYSYYGNRLQPKWGEVAQYELLDGFNFYGPTPPDQKKKGGKQAQPSQLIHADRLVRFDGVKLGPLEMLRNGGWGDSVLTRVYEIVRDDSGLWSSLSILMQDYSTAIMKMRGLAEALSVPNGQAIVAGRMQGVQLARSVARITLLDGGSGNPGDTGEEWSRDTISLSGVADMVDRFMQRVAMAARMPMTRLWGVSPGGIGDKGGSDLQWYHEDIERDQEVDLRPQLNKILRVLMRAQKGPLEGNEPERWCIKFNPLQQLTSLEEATRRKTIADTDVALVGAGILDPRECAKRFEGESFNSEIQLDEEVRELMDEKHQVEAEAALKTAERSRDGEPSPDVAAGLEAKAQGQAAQAKKSFPPK